MPIKDLFTYKELEHLGLTGKKADIFCILLEEGILGATDISIKSGIKRTTAYDLLNELCIQGVVDINHNGKIKNYKLKNPKNFQYRAKEKLLAIDNLLPKLTKIYEKTPGKPKFRYFEGIDGYIQINKELLQLNRGDQYYYFDVGMTMINRRGVSNLKRFVNERISRGIWSNSIRVKEAEIDAHFLKGSPGNLRRVRFFPKKVSPDFTAMYIFNNKVAFVPTKTESYSIIIDSAELAFSMKILWDIIWEISLTI